MATPISDAMHKICIALCHLWFNVQRHKTENKEPAEKAVFWVYSEHLGVGQEELLGKRIQVTIEIVEQYPKKKA